MLKEKKKSRIKKIIPICLAGFLYICLLFGVIVLMRYVQGLLDSDAKINLTEVVNQNKNVITSKLNLEVNNLEGTSAQIIDRYQTSKDKSIDDIFRSYYVDNPDDQRLFLGRLNGSALFTNEDTLDISERNYYKLASSGVQNISDRVVSKQDGKDIFIISVPLKYNGEIIGTLQKWYTPEDMYKLCSISLFSSQGQAYIINKDGYILISSMNGNYSNEYENYYNIIREQGERNSVKSLQNDLQNEKAGFMETVVNGKKMFSAYTPIDQVFNWYLISSVETSAVSPNGNIVVQMFYCMLVLVTLIFVVSIMAFLYYKNRQQNNLKRVAFVDSVTGGSTYTKFMLDLKEVIQESPLKQFYLMKFDIDNFKYVNNFYGFDFGDKILYKINKNITSLLGDDELIARVSSDHFVVLLNDDNEDKIKKIMTCMEDEKEISIYFTAGLYAIQDRDESINLMVDKASLAAAKSKANAHKKVSIYTQEFDKQMIENEQLKQAIKLAIVNNEIIPFYQPKVDVNTKRLVGAEALARWRKADGSLVPPDEFIPLCEKTGLVMDLDMSIFDQVLAFLQRNIESGIKCVPISVNFSRLHLLDSEFMNKVLAKMEFYKVPTNLIEMELTESIIFDNLQLIIDFIDTLHEKGFVVSMDDFGSGYSSLNMLKDIPIDTLKIDRVFLKDSTDSQRQRIIFSAITRMASQLNIKVVVEGVETIENVTLMKELGCIIAQGYYFAKPMDEESFKAILEKGKVS